MKRNRRLIPLAFLLLAPMLHGLQKTYQAGKIIDWQEKTKTRVLYYVVNTPITQDDPYYEVSVQIKDTVYVGEYTPRHSADTLPEEWKAGAGVQVRVEKHYIYLRRPDGGEFQLAIAKRSPANDH